MAESYFAHARVPSEPMHEADDSLLAFSEGRISRQEAVANLGLRDYAELLVTMGRAGLPLPSLPREEIERQVEVFVRLWKENKAAKEGPSL